MSKRGRAIAMAVVAVGPVIAIFALVTPGFGREATAAGETQRSRDCPEGALRLPRDAPAPATTAIAPVSQPP